MVFGEIQTLPVCLYVWFSILHEYVIVRCSYCIVLASCCAFTVTTNVLFSLGYSQRFGAPTLFLTLPPSLLLLLPCALAASSSPKGVRRKKTHCGSIFFLCHLKRKPRRFCISFVVPSAQIPFRVLCLSACTILCDEDCRLLVIFTTVASQSLTLLLLCLLGFMFPFILRENKMRNRAEIIPQLQGTWSAYVCVYFACKAKNRGMRAN